MRTQEWVVTYKLETAAGYMFVEFYRGTPAECKRIADRSESGEDDRYGALLLHRIILGPAADWDQFLIDAAEMPDVEAVVEVR